MLLYILAQYQGPLICKFSHLLSTFTILLLRQSHGEIVLLLEVVLENRSGDVEDDRRQKQVDDVHISVRRLRETKHGHVLNYFERFKVAVKCLIPAVLF